MSVEVIDQPPARESLTLLSDFQSETPSTFFGDPPVLHFHSSSQLLIPNADLEGNEVFQKLNKDSRFDWTDDNNESTSETAIPEVEIYALSTKLIIFSKGASGLSISYPSIALHAKGSRRSSRLPNGQSDVVYLQLNLHDPETINSDDEIQTVDLTIIPSDVTYPTTEATGGVTAPSPGTLLFEALSACANLHPDPESGSDEGAEPAPGTGGWITSENMADFMDADGNFVGLPTLGAGAGTVHPRDDDEDQTETAAVNGAQESDDTKWQRTG